MEPIPEPVSLNLSLVALEVGQCKYPHGDGPFVFCGNPTFDGGSYCEYHHRVCWQPIDEYHKRKTFRFYARAA